MKNIINNISLSYRDTRILSHVCGSMYLSGPKYRHAKKDMTRKERSILNSFDDNELVYEKRFQRLRMQHPVLFNKEEIDMEMRHKAENAIINIPITLEQLNLCIRAFDTTFEESIIDNYRDLEIITGFRVEEIRQVYEKLLLARNKMESL